MKKEFRLPKEFTTRWLKALRSGDYEQGENQLVRKPELPEFKKPRYCCLGVACSIAGVTDEEMKTFELPTYLENLEDIKIPVELKYIPDQDGEGNHKLVSTLVSMNDDGKSFKEIADWIEENVELY